MNEPSERAMKVAAQQMPFEAGFAKVSRVRLAVAIDRGLPGYEALLEFAKVSAGRICGCPHAPTCPLCCQVASAKSALVAAGEEAG